MIVVVYLVMCMFPVALLRLIAHGPPSLGWMWDRLRSLRRTRDRRAERDRLIKDLRRLGADHDKLMRTNRSARANQMRAIERAYDDTLRQACAVLKIEMPEAEFADSVRVQVEADLLVRGLTW